MQSNPLTAIRYGMRTQHLPLVFPLAFPLALAFSSIAQTVQAQPSAAVTGIARVDTLLAMNQLPAAITAVDQALAAAPRQFDVLWRASRVRALQGDLAPAKSKAQARAYKDALELAERAIKANGAAPDGYLRRAAAAGKVALFSGTLEAADQVVQAKEDAERVIAMRNAPPALQASAQYILGRTHLKLTETPRPLRMPLGLGFGNLADALVHLRRATELRPGFIMFQLDYARALIEDDRSKEARALLQGIAALSEQEIGDDARKRDAAALLATLRP
jgi:tetratricopeptide (TPR) repeat protein